MLRSIATCVRARVGYRWLAWGYMQKACVCMCRHKFWLAQIPQVDCPEDSANSMHALSDCCLMTNCACDQDSLLTKVRDDPHSSFMTQIHPAARFMPGHHQLKGAWKCWDGAASPGSASRRDGTGQEPARSPEPQSNELQDAASSAVLLVAK